MERNQIQSLLELVALKQITIEEALQKLAHLPYEDLSFAKVDHHRGLRQGFPEVVFCQGKTPEQVAEISLSLTRNGAPLLATRASKEDYEATKDKLPSAEYHPVARIITCNIPHVDKGKVVLLVSAGTSDLPVAEEAAVTLEAMGHPVQKLYDVGVAGIHRLLQHQKILSECAVIIVVAGMEGALASVVAGLTDKPVIAVPTSIGYGASFGGLAALLGMLNSCASGVGVMNIDNGFGAAALAHRILSSLNTE